MSTHRPEILVFDVNETVLDIRALEPLFLRLFGRPDAMREWYAQLILHSQSLTLAGSYVPLSTLGGGILRMLGDAHGVPITDDDAEALRHATAALPAHPDVRPGLSRLRAAGFRLVTLTNSAPEPSGSPLERAGIADLFEQQFSVDAVRRFKPAPETYRLVADALAVPLHALCLVAAHIWDTIGAKRLGCQAALVLRPGNAVLPCVGVPQPDWVVSDFMALADRLCAMPERTGSAKS
ncbi:haloacid dehalogenase type II [Lichenihabitans sp. Uapishka_5]|uniref:haloacid dehalogenase type II n=1 Tax=Lichenihabitans sp. Uapishka_5 TaxID=3037302 RepID=UPI0029E80526|nr:haloacid dehalogenase type II [Lichenihabitans sp. Uapishka_5]MDX7951996.1 haloacid dehalogenase type II [Lichenihabitans sp. Uapishka_5]